MNKVIELEENKIEENKKIIENYLLENPSHKKLLDFIQAGIFIRDDRKEPTEKIMIMKADLFRKLSEIYLCPIEYLATIACFELDKLDCPNFMEELKTRYEKGSLFIIDKDIQRIISIDYEKLLSFIHNTNYDNIELKGQSANKGIVIGKCRIIHNKNDIKSLQKGEILVSSKIRIEYTQAVKKCVGIITDEGGITCHAAIISRELGKPCIIGTKIATKVLKDGDLVEVNADNGTVRKLENENNETVLTNKFSVDDFIYSMGKGKKSDIKVVKDFLNKSDWDVQRFNASPVFVNPTGMGNNYIFQNYFGISYSGFFFNYRGHQREMGYNLKDFDRLWTKLGNSYLQPGFIEEVASDYYRNFQYFEDIFKQIDDGLEINENNVIKMLKIVNRAQCYSVGIAHSTELINYICTYQLKPLLEDAIGKEKFKEIESKIFVADSLSFFAVEQNELYKIAMLKKGRKQDGLLREHVKKWNWILNSYVGAKELDIEFFKNRMKKVLHDGEIKLDLKQRDKLISSLLISKNYKNIIKLINFTTSRHDNRKANILKTIGYFEKILRMLSAISKIKFEDLLYLSFSDIDCLSNLEDLIAMKQELKQRKKGVIYILNDLKEYIYTKNEYIKLNGILEKLYVEHDTKELKGFVANGGYVKGKVRICNSMEKINKFKEGEILVASMTRPEYIKAIKKCKAILTDEGGITCHAAIVSRELGKPCIIGTKIATQVLKDGDLVEFDANNGIVKILEQ